MQNLILENQYGEQSINVVQGDYIPLPGTTSIIIMNGATAPINGTTGDNIAGKGSIYIAQDTGLMYLQTGAISNPVWSLIEAGDSPLGQPLTGFVSGAGTVSASDTILTAFNKLVGNSQNLSVIGNLLTAFSAGAGTVSATDSILAALQKLTGNTQNLTVIGNLLTGFSASAGSVSATDSILVAFNKTVANLAAVTITADAALPTASFTAAAVTGKLLTGLAAGADTPIQATDSILVALANLQAQIDAL